MTNNAMISYRSTAAVMLGISCGLIFLGQDIRIGVRLRAFDLGVILISALFFWDVLNKGAKRGTGSFVFFFGTFSIYLFANATLQSSIEIAIRELAQLVFFGIFFLAVRQFISDRGGLTYFAWAFLITLWALAFHNAIFHLTMGEIAGWKQLGDQKLTHSVILVLMVAMTVAQLRPTRRWWIVLLSLAVIMLFASGERKGWAAAAVAIFGAMLISDEGGLGKNAILRTTVVAIVGLSIVGFAAILAPYIPYLQKQLFSSADFIRLIFSETNSLGTIDTTLSNRNRLGMIEIAQSQIRDHPLFGVGPGMFRADAFERSFLVVARSDIAPGPHNELLRITAELGYVGLAIYLSIYLSIGFRALVLISAMSQLTQSQRFAVRFGVSLLFFGFLVNFFLAGGGLNTFFLALPAGILYSVGVPQRDRHITERTRSLKPRALSHELLQPKA